MRIFVTGGHVTPALAVIDELLRLRPDTSIYFIGRIKAMEEDRTPSLEYEMVTRRGIRFLPISAGRLPRYISRTLFYSLGKFPIGCIQALWYVLRFRPGAVLSFGGYVSVPVCFAAWLCQVPIYIHEQAKVPGIANRMIAHFAKEIFVSFPEQAVFFPQQKTLVTGLPLRQILFHPPKKPTFAYEKNLPLLYITGGATGAATLNRLLFPIMSNLTKTFMVIHQTGAQSYNEARSIKSSRYFPTPTLKESDVSWVYHNATLVIGRSGANTVGEIAALGNIALFVPLPWAAGGEQEKNAKVLVDNGSAVMLSQKNLTPEKLLSAISLMMQKNETYKARARREAREFPRNAGAVLAQELIRMYVD